MGFRSYIREFLVSNFDAFPEFHCHGVFASILFYAVSEVTFRALLLAILMRGGPSLLCVFSHPGLSFEQKE